MEMHSTIYGIVGWLVVVLKNKMLNEALGSILGKFPVNYEELSATLCTCEVVISARHLTYISNLSDELFH